MQEEIGVNIGRVAGGAMDSAAVQERVQCAIEVGASILGAAMRVNLTFGCAMGGPTLRDVGRLKLTFLGLGSTLEDSAGLGALVVGETGAWGWEQLWIFRLVLLLVAGKAAEVKGFLAKLSESGG